MQITKEQEALVRAWAAEGASLSDIQTRLADECGLKLSYLETRFLLIDLKVDLAEKPEKKPAADPFAAGGGRMDAGGPDPRDGGEGFGPEDGREGRPYDDGLGEDDEEQLPESDADGAESPEAAEAPAGGSVSVELDRIQRPGFAASGSVVCSDGVKGEWGIDAYGRLALAFPGNKGYRPSAEDQRAFMDELRNQLSGGGY